MSDKTELAVGDKVRVWLTDDFYFSGTLTKVPTYVGDTWVLNDKGGDTSFFTTYQCITLEE